MAISKNKRRIQVVVEKNLFDAIEALAKRNSKSVSFVSGQLLKEGYENEISKGGIHRVTSYARQRNTGEC